MINTQQLKKYADKVTSQELKRIANITQDVMRGEVPVYTGVLRASIAIRGANTTYKIGHQPNLLIASSGENYGDIVYFGSGKRMPNRWIERTIAKLPRAIKGSR